MDSYEEYVERTQAEHDVDDSNYLEIESGEYSSQEHRPYVGMKFNSEEDAHNFYNLYAKKIGFGIRRDKIYFSSRRNCMTMRTFVCSKEGYKKKDPRSEGVDVKARREIREGCQAMMRVRLMDDDVWIVDAFKEDHNHESVSPSKVIKIRSHRRLTDTTMMIWNARDAALMAIDLGIQSVERYKVLMPVLRDVVENIGKIPLIPNDHGSIHTDNLSTTQATIPMTEHIHVRDPERATTKGRPKVNVRIRSGIEDIHHKAKQRTCGNCGKKGHYTTTCPDKKGNP